MHKSIFTHRVGSLFLALALVLFLFEIVGFVSARADDDADTNTDTDHGKLIIDTEFNKYSDGKFDVSPMPERASDFPLRTPTACQADAPSTVTPGRAPVGDWQPPFAIVKMAAAPGADPHSAVQIEWSFKDVILEPARYQITFQVMLSELSRDAGNFLVYLVKTNGQDPKGLHPIAGRPHISFSDGTIKSWSDNRPMLAKTPYTLGITIDTKRMTASTSINGDPLSQEQPFDKAILEQFVDGCRIRAVTFETSSGLDNSRPGSTLLIKKVEMRRVP